MGDKDLEVNETIEIQPAVIWKTHGNFNYANNIKERDEISIFEPKTTIKELLHSSPTSVTGSLHGPAHLTICKNGDNT